MTATLSEFSSTHTDYATGAGDCGRTDSHSMSYRISITLGASTPDAEQGQSIDALIFYWEAQSD